MSTTSNTTQDTWTITSLRVAINAPPPDINSGMVGFVDSNGNPRIFYVGQPINGVQPIVEVKGTGGTWVVELGVGQGFGPGAKPGTRLAGYLFNGRPSVYYIATGQHIQETYQVSNSWFTTDVTAASGAPLPAQGSPLMGYQFNSNGPIYFVANDSHVHQSWWNGSSWLTNDVTALAGATLVGGVGSGIPLMGYMFNGQPTVFYVDLNTHLIEMWWTGSQEKWSDWTVQGAGQVVEAGSPLTGYALSGQSTSFYLDNGTYLHETFWNGSSLRDIVFGHVGGGIPTGTGLASAIF